MPARTEHRFPHGLSVLDAVASRVTLAGTCPVCIQHARALSRLDLPTRGVQPALMVPRSPTHAAWVRRIPGDRVTVVSSAGARAHRAAGLHQTLLHQHSGITLADPAGVVRYRLATALPVGSFDGPALQAATGRL